MLTLATGLAFLAQAFPVGLVSLAVVFFIIAIVAYLFGANGVAGMSAGVGFRQFEVLQPGGRQPKLEFHGAARQHFDLLGCRHSHLSLAHDGGLAIACVVLED